jgi:hypothetical protein
MKQYHQTKKEGFALLYSVVIISLILTIAISISNTSYKQTILSSLAKDSQIAFYQADAGAECGMYYDLVLNQFPLGTVVAGAPATISCGTKTLALASGDSGDDYFVYEQQSPVATDPCFEVIFDKITDPIKSTIDARGNNRCGAGPRQVERAVRVQY